MGNSPFTPHASKWQFGGEAVRSLLGDVEVRRRLSWIQGLEVAWVGKHIAIVGFCGDVEVELRGAVRGRQLRFVDVVFELSDGDFFERSAVE